MNLSELESTPPWEWPADAGRTILAVLRDETADTETRMLAAYLGGDVEVVDDELAGALFTLVADPAVAEPLRAQAAIALGPALEHADITDYDDDEDDILIGRELFPRLCAGLRRVYEDGDAPKEVRRRVLEAAVRAPQDWHTEAVRRAFASADADWRLTAVFAMQYIEGFAPQVLASLDDPDPEIRLEAVTAAGNWGLEAAWDRVVRLAQEPETGKDLRLAAIEAVAGIRPEAAEEVLADLKDDLDEDILEAVRDALAMAGEIGDEFDGDDTMEDDD